MSIWDWTEFATDLKITAARIMATLVSARELRPGFEGTVLEPGDPGYDQARKIWNGMIDRRPATIARCQTPADVGRAMAFARQRDLPIAVKGGGHNVTGNAMCDGGVAIDLSLMRRVEVDPERKLVRVDGGALLENLDAATQAHGLATPTGINSTTGIAGLTLGGGIGHLMRSHGLTIDNLHSVDMVSATSERVRASDDENADLFWGIRGGGGNFGVVTSFTFRLHPVGPRVLSGLIGYRAERAHEVLRFYQDFARDAPDQLGTIVNLRKAPPAPFIPADLHGTPIVGIVPCYHGDPVKGEEALRPFRELGPDLYAVEPRPFVELQGFFNATVPHGWNYYWKSHFLAPLSDAAIDTIAQRAWRMRSPRSYTLLFHMGGAVSRVSDDAAAFTGRGATHALVINGAWAADDPEDANDTAWARNLFDAMQPYGSGVYVNFLGSEGQDRVRAAYGAAKYERLAKLKARWDPDNIFHLNQNVLPAKPT